MQDVPIVYLDTQDYSKIAEARLWNRGEDVLNIFNALLNFKINKRAIFAYSFPILSELLQYSEKNKEITIEKARVVEDLCGNHAFMHPSVIVSEEVKRASEEKCLNYEFLSGENRWFPTTKSMFEGLDDIVEEKLDEEIQKTKGTLNRKTRRYAKKKIRPKIIAQFSRDYASKLAGHYPLSEKFFTNYLADALEKRIPYPELDKLFYAEVQKPTNFLTAYFEQYGGDASLPFAMRSFGEKLVPTIERMRTHVETLVRSEHRSFATSAIADFGSQLALTMIEVSKREAETTGWNEKAFQEAIDRGLHKETAFYRTFGSTLTRYLTQNLGIHRNGPHPKESDGGDLMHLVYLPHASLWRSDARFCETVSQACPWHRKRIVRRLSELPQAIEALN
ncbi:hypothetical protein [Parasphingopyxis marina]|uniref:Uncharacterized protein n=1 Tax=Parasphingopyxis marina TaxID=2761622 RepID=A0A842HVZ6_9SPHN|nr:hypothetical protein [Parasphingopyxis marina]MBC2776597.1 hypothetical protein [Parasphingopyxis marina]